MSKRSPLSSEIYLIFAAVMSLLCLRFLNSGELALGILRFSGVRSKSSRILTSSALYVHPGFTSFFWIKTVAIISSTALYSMLPCSPTKSINSYCTWSSPFSDFTELIFSWILRYSLNFSRNFPCSLGTLRIALIFLLFKVFTPISAFILEMIASFTSISYAWCCFIVSSFDLNSASFRSRRSLIVCLSDSIETVCCSSVNFKV